LLLEPGLSLGHLLVPLLGGLFKGCIGATLYCCGTVGKKPQLL
jgi:hypothetical protein